MYGALGINASVGEVDPRTNTTDGDTHQSVGFSLLLFSPTSELLSFAVFSFDSRMKVLETERVREAPVLVKDINKSNRTMKVPNEGIIDVSGDQKMCCGDFFGKSQAGWHMDAIVGWPHQGLS